MRLISHMANHMTQIVVAGVLQELVVFVDANVFLEYGPHLLKKHIGVPR